MAEKHPILTNADVWALKHATAEYGEIRRKKRSDSVDAVGYRCVLYISFEFEAVLDQIMHDIVNGRTLAPVDLEKCREELRHEIAMALFEPDQDGMVTISCVGGGDGSAGTIDKVEDTKIEKKKAELAHSTLIQGGAEVSITSNADKSTTENSGESCETDFIAFTDDPMPSFGRADTPRLPPGALSAGRGTFSEYQDAPVLKGTLDDTIHIFIGGHDISLASKSIPHLTKLIGNFSEHETILVDKFGYYIIFGKFGYTIRPAKKLFYFLSCKTLGVETFSLSLFGFGGVEIWKYDAVTKMTNKYVH